MDSDPRPSTPDGSYDGERPVVDDNDDVQVPLDAPFEVPVADALEQERTVVLDDDHDSEPSA